MIGEMLRAICKRGLVLSQTNRVADASEWLVDHGATCVLLALPPDQPPAAAVEQLGEAAPHAPIIVLSDHPDEDLGLAAVRAGAQDYLLKSELSASSLGRAVRYAVERKRSEVALARRAMHDPLTSLPNRTLFVDRLGVALDRSRRTGAPVVVLFLDVDDFKHINDSLGHAAGDRVLSVLADRFRGLLRPMDTVARFGGDEFTFLFEGFESQREATLVAQRISRSAGAPLAIGNIQLSVSVSIGMTIIDDPAVDVEQVIGQADQAMYRAKNGGGARYEVFDRQPPTAPPVDRAGQPPPPLDLAPPPPPRPAAVHPRATFGADNTLPAALGRAVERDELRIHYQPRVSLADETGLVGFEALVRWEHPELGLMEPDEFMAVAEETGLIVPIDEWVLAQALRQVQRWRRSRPEVSISVNLSPRELADPELVERLRDTMIDLELDDPAALCLEVTEAALEVSPDVAIRQLAALAELGVQLAVDDFGTGRALPATLERMPLSMIKIDRSLVARITEGAAEAASVSAAVDFGHNLGVKVVAEGVETDAQLATLRALGCDGAQGYLFSQPMPVAEVETLLATR